MTTSTLDPVAALVALADTLPAARTAQYESKLQAARAGTLSTAHAAMILRQLGGFSSPAMGEAQITMPRSSGNSTSTRSNDASEAQARFAADLLRTRCQLDERVVGTVKTVDEVLRLFEARGTMSRDMARNVIDAYKDRPRVSQPAPAKAAERVRQAAPVDLESGIYRLGDDWFKVQKAVYGSGNMYAKQLVVHGEGNATFEYAPGAIRKLTPDHKVSLEEAKKFGHVYGVCCNCGKTLTDEESIRDGIGPVCKRKKNYWA